MKRKIKGQGGFSLAETLLATLILLLVGLIMTTGIPAAKTAYEKVVLGSNAQVLLSTTVSALRDELGTAWDVTPSADKKSVTYFSANTGTKSVISLKSPEGASYNTIYRQEFAEESTSTTDIIFGKKLQDADDDTYGRKDATLISGAASTSALYATYGEVSVDKGIVTFTNVQARRKSNDNPIAALDKLEIRVIAMAGSDGT